MTYIVTEPNGRQYQYSADQWWMVAGYYKEDGSGLLIEDVDALKTGDTIYKRKKEVLSVELPQYNEEDVLVGTSKESARYNHYIPCRVEIIKD